ncbi:VOC family protein [Petropleomorpha daqingensis]|uniref:Glyoxylase I family protein n=1 Tax=Petropleomorpha daqingensis TaxID=2026353 RepID=A0A853CJ24_9ACTN|nr:VOC family protein [Petropleomorpha daqingensis]NYJ07336.1 glyoxylase I family protein [Petropleomorpha daqingensis]
MTAPPLAGLSHVGLSVADLDAAVAFWSGTMGFEVLDRAPAFALLLYRPNPLVIGLANHDGAVTGPFDERRTGLDHLALAVSDTAALQAWIRRLEEAGIPHSGPVDSEFGAHLNFRGPDAFPVELFVLAPAGLEALGLDPAVTAPA